MSREGRSGLRRVDLLSCLCCGVVAMLLSHCLGLKVGFLLLDPKDERIRRIPRTHICCMSLFVFFFLFGGRREWWWIPALKKKSWSTIFMQWNTHLLKNTALSRYNWHTINCIYLNYTIWYVLTYASTRETVTVIKIVNISVAPQGFPHSPPTSRHPSWLPLPGPHPLATTDLLPVTVEWFLFSTV